MYGPVHNSSVGNTYSANPGTSSASSPFSSFLSGSGGSDVLSLSGQPGEGKSEGFFGKIKDFGKGIFKGAVNTITSLFTLKGLLMTLGSVALVAVAGPVAIPLLIAGGLAVGGMQMAKGAMSGDWSKAGEGAFTVGATLLGAKMGPKSYKVGNSEYALNVNGAKPTGFFDTTLAHMKTLVPGKWGSKLHKVGPDGQIIADASQAKGAFGLAKETAGSTFSGLKKHGQVLSDKVLKKSGDKKPKVQELTEQRHMEIAEKFKDQSNVEKLTTVQSLVRRRQAQQKLQQLKVEKQAKLETGETSTLETGKKSFFSRMTPQMDSPSTAGVVLGSTISAGLGSGLMTEEEESTPPG